MSCASLANGFLVTTDFVVYACNSIITFTPLVAAFSTSIGPEIQVSIRSRVRGNGIPVREVQLPLRTFMVGRCSLRSNGRPTCPSTFSQSAAEERPPSALGRMVGALYILPVLTRDQWLSHERTGLRNRLFGGRVAPLVAHSSLKKAQQEGHRCPSALFRLDDER